MDLDALPAPTDGRQSRRASDIQRGVMRLMRAQGAACVTELALSSGHRADVVSLDQKGGLTIIEIKSSLADFRADSKWEAYLDHCDQFYFAVAADFPRDVLPEDAEVGVMLADRYGAEIIREADAAHLNAARRKAVTLRLARAAALRLQTLADPEDPNATFRGQ